MLHVAVEQTHDPSLFALCLQEGKICAHGHLPRPFYHFGNGFLEPLCKFVFLFAGILRMLPQMDIEHFRLQGSESHPLSMDWIETTDGIAQDHKTIWKTRHALIMSPAFRGILVGKHWC